MLEAAPDGPRGGRRILLGQGHPQPVQSPGRRWPSPPTDPWTSRTSTSQAAWRRRCSTRCPTSAFPSGAYGCVVGIDRDTGAVDGGATTCASTTAAPSSTRSWPRARSRAVWPRGSPRPSSSTSPSTRAASPSTGDPDGLPRARRASDLPALRRTWVGSSTPTENNSLGAKGIGESGAVGAPPAVANAVVDALLGLRRQAPRHAVPPGEGVECDERARS